MHAKGVILFTFLGSIIIKQGRKIQLKQALAEQMDYAYAEQGLQHHRYREQRDQDSDRVCCGH